ncbi:helix-turn-helix domain-containing protein [Corynebacterium sp. CCM 9186]|uniref:helix-turn-helix domain-containing protein n=1 Tax=Corynebacterium meridianum TaxID=2765363 RepID=UPI0020035178|nr:helix-turn-helix domain-containing protein [Corynebacterium meridianum]MCK7676995.1 helix-turn-helix domain-containing protein [Corynebacterium meridianum]
MNQKHLELLELVPGARDFTVVQPTELEDPGEFLVPGAIVLTVGISFAGEPERLTGYCRALADAGAAAVGLGTGLVFDEVPAELVVGARAAGLAVFEVPRHIPFASILGAVEDERTRLGNIERERLINAQELLSQYAVTGGLEALGRQLSEVLDSAVAIVDNDARSVLREDRGTRCATAVAVDAVRAGRDSAGPTTDGDGFTHTYRMSRHGERFHVLAVETPGPLGPSGRALIRHAAGLADILIQRPAHLRAARAEMNTMAMAILLGVENTADTVDRVFGAVTDARGKIRPVIIHGDHTRAVESAVSAVDDALECRGRYLYSLRIVPNTVLLLFRGDRANRGITELLGAAAAEVRVAIGPPVHWRELTPNLVDDLVIDARSRALGVSGGGTGGARWIHDPAVRAALDTRAAQTWERLVDHDRRNGTELADTLATYLRGHGRITTCAETLGVHRHTVRTRLARISEVTEVDLSDPVACAELLLVIVTRTGGE